jgi:hypothetical protein
MNFGFWILDFGLIILKFSNSENPKILRILFDFRLIIG